MENCISLLGFFAFAGVAWVLSENRRKINWRPVIIGMLLQFLFAFVLFCVPVSREFFLWFSNGFCKLLELSREGITFVFARLGEAPSGKHKVILATQVFPFMIIFASIMYLLYYLKVIQFIVESFAKFLSQLLRTSGAETLCATSNVFVGIESATAIKPYLSKMTRSELFTVLVVGMSTIASTILVVYVLYLQAHFSQIAGHLVSASILSVPAAFVISKLMIPETGRPETMDAKKCEMYFEKTSSCLTEAIIDGATVGAKLAVGVGVTLIAFIGLLSIVNGLMEYVLGHTLQYYLSYVFYPFAFLLGIPGNDTEFVAKLLGIRVIATEIPAYMDLATFAKDHPESARTVLVASYALCGFTHIASVAIFVGGIGAIVPERMKELSKLGFRALVGATLVTLMTGAIAGIFYWGQQGIITLK